MPIVKNLIAKKEVTICTSQETVYLNKGDVGLVRFRDEKEFEQLRALGNFDIYAGPPPRVIDLRQQRQVPQANVTIPTAEVVEPEVEIHEEPITESTSSIVAVCPECETPTVEITDDSEQGVIKTIAMCPNCKWEEVIGEKSVVVEKKVRTRVVKKQGKE